MLPILLISVYAEMLAARELTYYADFEHPNVTYWNPKYVEFITITAQRYSRRDPIHYLSVHVKSLIVFGNDILVDAYLYEFLSNEYRRSMIEVHHRLCDPFYDKKYDFLKTIYTKYLNATWCPYPKGEYHFTNMSFPNMPLLSTFPFLKGRLFLTQRLEKTGEKIMEVYIDAVIKQRFL